MDLPAVFDLHCDTLTEYASAPASLDGEGAAFALSRLPEDTRWAQCTAVFLPDHFTPEQRKARYRAAAAGLRAQEGPRLAQCRTARDIEAAWAQKKTAAVLTVENGSLLCGQLSSIGQLAADGVRMLTLTWNGVNELGSGNVSDEPLTKFGKEAVSALEAHNIIVDVSHLNRAGFRDVLETARKPFAASHSNCRALCDHPRDLEDWQLREMIGRDCLIGLNFYSPFLRADGAPADRADLLRHAEHILALGGENCLALGSDFDGAALPPELDSAEKEAGLRDFFLARGFSRALTEKLMFRNALEFFRRNSP